MVFLMEDVLFITSWAIPAVLIWRYRAAGVLVSIPIAFGLLMLILLLPHPDTYQEREDREDCPMVAGLMSIVWCLVVATVFTFGRWLKARRSCHAT
jgi:hypothetical protein